MKRFTVIVMLIAALVLSACNVTFNLPNTVRGSGKLSTETRQVSGFTRIIVNGSGDAQITVGDSESLSIEAEDNILPLLTSDVANGTLTLGFKNNTSVSTTRPIRYTITVKALNAIEMNGSGNSTVGNVQTDNMSMVVRGSGDISLGSLQASKLSVEDNGSGDLAVDGGKVDSLAVTIAGSGSFTAPNMECQAAQVSIAGSGDVTLWAKGTLQASIFGSGNINYYGSPTVSQNVTGTGRLSGKGNK